MKLFIEDNEAIPAAIVGQDIDPTPPGFTESTEGSPFGDSHIEDWHYFGMNKVGSVPNFMDWKCLRDIIRDLVYAKAGTNLANYTANLSAAERKIASIYMPTKIADLLGFAQLATDSGGVTEAFNNLNHYLDRAKMSRELRYIEIVDYVYRWLGKNFALQAEDDVRVNYLKSKYIERGVMYTSLDTVDGFIDWVMSTDNFTNNGLKKKLQLAVWNIKAGGPDIDTFCDNIKGCAEDGVYPIP